MQTKAYIVVFNVYRLDIDRGTSSELSEDVPKNISSVELPKHKPRTTAQQGVGNVLTLIQAIDSSSSWNSFHFHPFVFTQISNDFLVVWHVEFFIYLMSVIYFYVAYFYSVHVLIELSCRFCHFLPTFSTNKYYKCRVL